MASTPIPNNPGYKEIKDLLEKTLGNRFNKFFPENGYRTPRDFRISIPCLIETQSYAIFQSEPGRLDKATFSRGVKYLDNFERVECHESKVKQEIRRASKRLTRKLSDPDKLFKEFKGRASTDKKDNECNIPDCLCGICRDCRVWGFAAAGSTEEREENSLPARVDVDTTWSIRSSYNGIMVERTWNAVDEADRRVRRAIGEKEQLSPQVFLPYVLDLRDVSLDEFLYVLYGLLNAKRIGAGRTKYGSITVEPLGLFFTYEQLFTNKKLAQHAYDCLWDKQQTQLDENKRRLGWLGELTEHQAKEAMKYAIQQELQRAACWYWPQNEKEPPAEGKSTNGDKSLQTPYQQFFDTLLTKAKELFRDEEAMQYIADARP
jgi:CRISPR type I-D-associated protein Csc2